MSFDPERYTHDSDRSALKALQSIPGFSLLIKGFMNLWNEPQERILNMSTRIKLGDNQMKKYYDMLPPICEKLGIPVPDLYLELDVKPNAYTYGDSNPFIVLTSGLLKALPEDLIPTILAHECGHIACHHALYRTMGRLVLSGASTAISSVIKLGGLLTVPLQVAFYYWMRCSEFSADRAAVLCDGTASKMQEVCMRLAGWDKDIMADANIDAFLQQAADYKEMINGNAWNKTLEYMIMSQISHPLTAVRAMECGEWAKSDLFNRILNGIPDPAEAKAAEEAPVNDAATSPVEPQKPEPFDILGLMGLKKQEEDKPEQPTVQAAPVETEAEKELRWYRKMAEEGLITWDQYEQKKKELLGE